MKMIEKIKNKNLHREAWTWTMFGIWTTIIWLFSSILLDIISIVPSEQEVWDVFFFKKAMYLGFISGVAFAALYAYTCFRVVYILAIVTGNWNYKFSKWIDAKIDKLKENNKND